MLNLTDAQIAKNLQRIRKVSTVTYNSVGKDSLNQVGQNAVGELVSPSDKKRKRKQTKIINSGDTPLISLHTV